jgi:hypothetical protein
MKAPRYLYDQKRRIFHLPYKDSKNPGSSLCGDMLFRGKAKWLLGGVIRCEEQPEAMCPKCLEKEAE